MTLLPLHIVAGLTAIVTGYVAIAALKGARLHRRSGMIFVYAMLMLGLTGAIMATLKSQPANIVGGIVALYMAATGVLTFHRRDAARPWIDAISLLAALGIAWFSARFGLEASRSATHAINGVPAAPLFVFAGIALLAAAGDLRMLVTGGLRGRHLLARHLWRMSFALFIATGSFFIGQAKVIPKPVRILPLLAVPAFLPLVLLFYWLVRVSLARRAFSRASEPRDVPMASPS
ncbi:MAG TPA: hypothetical protein VFN38_09280 [Gemmatimonadaceae bacterium]|nr:hypothetical protein [Gemmatimonadaceae bacterium]